MNNYIQLPLFPPEIIEIPLANGYTTIIDRIDCDLALIKWSVSIADRQKTAYANYRGKGLHRVILSRILGRDLLQTETVDHIDRDSLNNCRNNLRLATHSQNNANRGKHKNNQSGYKGVYWDRKKKKWRAVIRQNYKTIHIGYFESAADAHTAYCVKAIELFGEFARFD